MAKLSTITLPDGNTYDLYWPGSNPDAYTGSIDSTSITPGIYALSGVSVNGKTIYGTFTQYGDTYKTQVFCAGPAGVARIYIRRYLTGSSSWSPFAALTPYGEMETLTPTKAQSTTTINRSHFMRLGPLVFVHFGITTSTSYSTNTNLFTGLPVPDDTTDFVAASNGSAYKAYINTSGQLKNAGAWPAENYSLNGWYYTTA